MAALAHSFLKVKAFEVDKQKALLGISLNITKNTKY